MSYERIQLALLTVPGVKALMPSGADGKWGPQSDKALDFVVSQAGGAIPPVDQLPAGYLDVLARIESNHRLHVKASTSSASGLYQFIRATWIGEGGAWGPNMALAFGGLTPSKAEQDRRVTTFTLKNARALAAAGLPVNTASLYVAHFMGVGKAVQLLREPDAARADHIAGPAATTANPSVLKGKTVGQFIDFIAKKTGVRAR